MFDPYALAEASGIDVIHRKIRSAHGLWLPEHNLIVVRTGLRQSHDRTVLTHELGHALLGHEDDSPKHELQADMFAARKLISACDFEQASRVSTCCWHLAQELGTTQRIVKTYLKYFAH